MQAKPHSLRWRLSWLFAALTMLGFGALSGAIYAASASHLARKAEAELGRKVALVSGLVQEAASTGDEAAMRHKLAEFFAAHEDMRVTLFGADGAVAFQSSGDPRLAPHLAARFDAPTGALGGRVASGSIEMDRTQDEELLSGLAWLLVAATFVGSLSVCASAFWLTRRTMLPLFALARQTRELGAERLSGARLSMERPVEELMPWVDEFNALLSRLDGAYRQLEAFNADVAHELRTPLTTLMGQTEVAFRRPRSPEALRSVLESNLEELQRLSGIVNDMLFLARADGGEIARASPPASVREQAIAAVEFHEAALAEAGLEARVDGDALASFDAGLVRRALSNLLGNAIRHSDEGSTIALRVDAGAGCTRVSVTNPGARIPPDALRRMFDRFYRGEEPRSGGCGRHGLGLAIVAAIAGMHGGRAFAASADGLTTVGFTIGESAPARGGDSERAGPRDAAGRDGEGQARLVEGAAGRPRGRGADDSGVARILG